MRFFLISGPTKNKKDIKASERLLGTACEKRGIKFVVIDSTIASYNLPLLGFDDMVYRITVSERARLIEKQMLNAKCSHIYDDLFAALSSRGGSYFLHKKLGLPIIPTIPFIPELDIEIDAGVESLGGYPIIVKVVGGSLGIGVIRIDSRESLRSLLDYFRESDTNVYIRKYIEHEYQSRVVVVGEKVVSSHNSYPPIGEFRSNVGNSELKHREIIVLPTALQEVAVKAVRTLRLGFAGVDILFDKEEVPYIAEVNSPFDFADSELFTGDNIAGAFVDFLIDKAAQNIKKVDQ